MKFLIDAQLPRRMARRLHAAGHDAIHTLDLSAGNRTTDAEISRMADRDGRALRPVPLTRAFRPSARLRRPSDRETNVRRLRPDQSGSGRAQARQKRSLAFDQPRHAGHSFCLPYDGFPKR
jgi:hypothetical protein